MRPPRPIATEHRKGAYAAALAEREHDGELEPPRPSRDYAPVDATDHKDLARKLLVKSLRTLEEDMAMGEPRERQEAARTLAVVCEKLIGDDPPVAPDLTPEERRAKLLENFRDPDPELLAVMREAADDIQKALKGT